MTRTLIDGTIVPELETALTITIKTKCPAKWCLVDMETGEVYEPYTTPGSLQWKKVYVKNDADDSEPTE